MGSTLEHWDTFLFTFLNSIFSNTYLNYFFVAITDASFWILPVLITSVIFILKGKKKSLVIIALSIIAVSISDPVSSQVVKPLFERHRPCHPDTFVQGAHFLLGFKRSDSFPSSHATNMFSLAMLLSMFYPKRWYYFFSFAGLIGFSRIYVGVHYPGDVLGGAVLGIVIGYSVFIIYRGVIKYSSRVT